MEQQDNHNTQQKNEVALKTYTNTTITKQTPPQIEVIDINPIIAHTKIRKKSPQNHNKQNEPIWQELSTLYLDRQSPGFQHPP